MGLVQIQGLRGSEGTEVVVHVRVYGPDHHETGIVSGALGDALEDEQIQWLGQYFDLLRDDIGIHTDSDHTRYTFSVK
jgi:hypothetical protein